MSSQKRPPNLLVIITDEHAPQTMGCMGADFVHTPNMDRLAAGGVTFENAYCNFALCVPSRASFMTGLFCHRIGAYDNGSPFGSDIPTWAHLCQAAGLRTLMNGKMHFVGPDQSHGFEEHWNGNASRIYGFRWGSERPTGEGYRHWADVEITPDDQFHCVDIDRRDAAVEFLRAHPEDQPYCMTIGFGWPHYPQRCTTSAWKLYENADLPEPSPRTEWTPRVDHWSDNVWGYSKFTPEETDRARRAYLAMVTMVDGWIGEVVDAMRARSDADETLVVYMSDHGDMWGEHELWGKNLFYEESSRVPLIFSGAAMGVQEGARVSTPVSLVDLHPTFRDVLDVDWPVQTDGRSLWATCRGEAQLDEIPIFCDYYSCDTKGPERMIRFGKHKLNYYHNQGVEMFDLEADPRELRNVADEPEYAEVRKELMRRLVEDWDPQQIDAEIRDSQNRRAMIGRAHRGRRSV